eukprot:scaffold28227_cov118-Isochrysis_galbana.AAC.1
MHTIGLDQEAVPPHADVEEVGVAPPDGIVRGQVDVHTALAQEPGVVVPDPPILALPRHPDGSPIRLSRARRRHTRDVLVSRQSQRHLEASRDVGEGRGACGVALRIDQFLAPRRRLAREGAAALQAKQQEQRRHAAVQDHGHRRRMAR